MKPDLHGALQPIVRQAIQHIAGVVLGAGVLSENESAIVAGAVMAVANVAWMLVARAKAPKP
jgi:hypothetical protein